MRTLLIVTVLLIAGSASPTLAALPWDVAPGDPSRATPPERCPVGDGLIGPDDAVTVLFLADGVITGFSCDGIPIDPSIVDVAPPIWIDGVAIAGGDGFITEKDAFLILEQAVGLVILLPMPQVEVDIKPSSDINPINPFAPGMVPVAILSSDEFDAETVDATTLAFGPDGASPMHAVGGHLQDVNDDGLMDLLSHYRIQETGIAIGDTEACVTGETLDGIPLEGCDSINTQPPGQCGLGFELLFLLPPLLWLRQRRRTGSA